MTAELRQSRASNWDEEIELLARALPPDLARALHERIDPSELLEIVIIVVIVAELVLGLVRAR